MFLSYAYIPYITDDRYCYRYEIIDSDFVGVVGWEALQHVVALQLTAAVIKIYESRKLNVPINLALLFQFMHSRGDKISDLINWSKEYVPEYCKYADKVEEYVVWI